MKKTAYILLVSCIAITSTGYCQKSTDTIIMDYLRTVKDIPAPVLEVSKKKKKTIRTANFFVEPTDSLQHGDTKFNTFLFGSAASHTRKYFLLQVKFSGKTLHKIIDSAGLEPAIADLFAYIKEFKLSEAEKSVLVRELTYAYN